MDVEVLSITYYEKILWITATICSVLYVAKLALSFIVDADAAMDIPDHDFQFFSLQTILLFLLSYSWMSIFLIQGTKMNELYSSFFGLIFGIMMSAFEIFLFTQVRKMHEVHITDVNKAIGEIGTVYLTIPEGGVGEVQVSFEGSLKNMKAVSQDGKSISAFHQIKVVSIQDSDILVVIKI